jgi:proteasome lid subunit RPN8/RPN11
MVGTTKLAPLGKREVLIRFAAPEFDQLLAHVFARYPHREWATFARFGWRETSEALVLTLAQLVLPEANDLDVSVPNVAFQEQYTLRMALESENGPLAVGVVHSHPSDCAPMPSPTDDDMDAYFAEYFGGFGPGRPYISLIISRLSQDLVVSGRVYWRDQWHIASRLVAIGSSAQLWVRTGKSAFAKTPRRRTERLSAALGEESAELLRESSVAVVGVGGTGSVAAEVLARAGVGELILIDPDSVEESNLERVHGSVPEDALRNRAKVEVAKRHVLSIDSSCRVRAIRGAIPQPETIDAIVRADVVLCCTDSQVSRLVVSDLAVRYLVPAMDCGVTMEGNNRRVTGEVMQFVRFLPYDACALCRDMIAPTRIAQELMSDEEKAQRQRAAEVAALSETANPDAYWRDMPQLNTVGFLTTAAGSIAAGFAIGWVSKRFNPPFSRLQLNLVAPLFEVVDSPVEARPSCTCRRVRGFADQALGDAYVTPPTHWPPSATL